MAVITKGRTQGTWEFRIELGSDLKGKRLRKRFTVRGTKKDAETRRAEMVRLINKGDYIEPSSMPLADYLRIWERDYVNIHLELTTARSYRSSIYTHLIPSIGHVRLNELRKPHLNKYFLKLKGKGLKSKTLRNHYMVLQSMITWAMDNNDLTRNPLEKISASEGIFKDGLKQEMEILDPKEVILVLDVAKQWYPIYYSAFYLDLYTGLRRSELMGLTWVDVDWTNRKINVNKGRHRIKKETIITPPKTTNSRRKISISDQDLNVLKEYKEWLQDKEQQLGVKITEDSDFIFRNETLTPMLPDSLSKNWVNLIKRAGIKKNVRFHDVRHTHASLLVHKGINFKIIQKRMGHWSVSLTLDTYSHLMQGDDEVASEALHDLIASVS